MTVQRTKQDIINRREANRRYYKLEENRETKRSYQRKYSLGLRGTDKLATPDILKLHEEWAVNNGYRAENLHAQNSKRFVEYEKKSD
jgi:hypothetical protein|tara:strand:+ start:543 stop:803 length:261 start_codon:yes stop_codon:yes gene_type:complete